MMTVISYATAKYSSSLPTLKLVWAGHEPREFINFFPEWIVNDFVARSNEEVGCLSPVDPIPNISSQWLESDDLLSAYEELSRSEYSWEELQARPLPPGVDPAKIETYLSDSVFMEKFKMSKEEFSACPRWKQVEMKKVSGLF